MPYEPPRARRSEPWSGYELDLLELLVVLTDQLLLSILAVKLHLLAVTLCDTYVTMQNMHKDSLLIPHGPPILMWLVAGALVWIASQRSARS